MKIRTGFVSNSSSMAYILIFDTPIESAHQLRKALFGDGESITYNYDKIANYIFGHLGKFNDWCKIFGEIRTVLDCNEIYTYDKDKYYKQWNKLNWKDEPKKKRWFYNLYRAKQRTKARKLLLEYCKEYDLKNKFSYIVEYEDSFGGDMYYHNGEPFEDIDCISISHH